MQRNCQQNAVTLALALTGIFAATSCGINSYAATATANLGVSVSVPGSCTISGGTLGFGIYDPQDVNPLNATGTVSTTCTSGVSGTVTLGQGANSASGSSDSTPLRQMASGSNRLSYSLWQNTQRTTVWGNTSNKGVATNGTLTIYGSIPSGQSAPSGSYSDTVQATVTF